MRVDPSTTSIIRYRYELSGEANYNLIGENGLARDYLMMLSTEAQSLLEEKQSSTQIMTFEISCRCSVTIISEFICFGLSL